MKTVDENAVASVQSLNRDFEAREKRKRLARVITFGCQMNEYDSEKLAGLLVRMGYEIEAPPRSGKFGNPAPLGSIGSLQSSGNLQSSGSMQSSGSLQSIGGLQSSDESKCGRLPDLAILNTCCVRENAEQRFYGILGALKRFMEEDPSRVLAVCGCMAQLDKAVADISRRFRYVDFMFGTRSIADFPALLNDALQKKETYFLSSRDRAKKTIPVINGLHDPEPSETIHMHRKAPPLALIGVMSGCDNFCSYCIVPYVRGRERSRTPQSILSEAAALAQAGYREITLLGQNVNSYGKDLRDGEKCDFPALLREVSKIDGIARIRFITSHPKDMSDSLIFAMRDIDAVCPHLHLPAQSGSSAVLKRMNRKYGGPDYIELIRKVRLEMPDVTLTTDIIVGFPGESDADFEDTLALIREADFDMAFTFIYSPREGTAAAEFPERVDAEVVKKRFNRLIELQNQISYRKNAAHVGKVMDVLCEGVSKTNSNRLTGRTPGGKVVNFRIGEGALTGLAGLACLTGEIIGVKIEKARTWSLEGVAESPVPKP